MSETPDKNEPDSRFVRFAFYGSLAVFGFSYGVLATQLNLFPAHHIQRAFGTAKYLVRRISAPSQQINGHDGVGYYYYPTDRTQAVVATSPSEVMPGLTLISSIGTPSSGNLLVRIVDTAGTVLHHWDVDVFKIWPNFDHLPEADRPNEKPGTNIHGIALLENGDIVFNTENVGLVRMDYCGRVVWRLPKITHHQVEVDGAGNFWVPTRELLSPSALPPGGLNEYLLKISPDGQVLKRIFLPDVFAANHLYGLMYMFSGLALENEDARDPLHLNSVELFPPGLKSKVFSPGDIMISLRNPSAIIVFDANTLMVKFSSIGQVLAQHDPHFIEGDKISVFDNNDIVRTGKGILQTKRPKRNFSKIVELSAKHHPPKVVFQGTEDFPFYSKIMGKHQRLLNGNILITESIRGRVFEITRHGKVIWEFYNIVADGKLGLVDEGERLASTFDESFFRNASKKCQ